MITRRTGCFQFVTYIFLFVILTGSLVTYESDSRAYIAVALYIMCFLPTILMRGKMQIFRFPVVVSVVMLLIWAYGFSLGMIKGNNTSFVIRNFAGMSVYILVFPLLNSRIRTEKYISILKKVSDYTLFISIFTYVMLTFFHFEILYKIPVINAFVGGGGIDGFVQYFCRELIHVSFAYNFFVLIVRNDGTIKSTIMLILSLYATIFVNDSGGDILAMGTIAIIILLTQVKHLNPRVVILGIIVIVALISFYFHSGEGLISKIFSPTDSGNIRRWAEINYFKNDMSFWGHGLGKELGFAGADRFNYGTEMIYFNIFHKFGIFAVGIFICYIVTCINAISFLADNTKKDPDKVIPLALMAYLVPSLANPMLFSVMAVVSHLLSMIIVVKYKKEGIELNRNIG